MGLNKEVHTMSTQNIDTLDEFRKDMEREKSERRALFFKALGIDDDGRRHPVMTEEEFREFVKVKPCKDDDYLSNGYVPTRGKTTVVIFEKYAPFYDISFKYCFEDDTVYEYWFYIGD